MNKIFLTMLWMVPAVVAADVVADMTGDVTGHWEGVIQAPETSIAIVVDIAKQSDGKLGGTIGMPSESLVGLPLKGVTVSGTAVRFHARLDQEFSGAFVEDGKSLSGVMLVEGFQIPASLTRTGDAKIEPRPKSAAVPQKFAGTWTGSLGRESVRLVIANQTDGTATASVFNVDEGELEIPASTIAVADAKVTLGLKAIGGSLNVELNADGSLMAGTFQQGGASVGLKLIRAK